MSMRCITLLTLLLIAGQLQAEPVTEFSPELLQLVATLPVQEGGRVKPLDTYASFLLLRVNGRRAFIDDQGQSRSAIEWLLEAILVPERSSMRKVFLVANDEVLDAINIDHAGRKKRDRYSFHELEPALGTVYGLAGKLEKTETSQRSPVESQIIDLARNLHEYEMVIHVLDFGRTQIDTSSHTMQFDLAFPGRSSVTVSEALARVDTISQMWQQLGAEYKKASSAGDGDEGAGDVARLEAAMDEIQNFFRALETALRFPTAFAYLPPPDAPPGHEDLERTWLSTADLASMMVSHGLGIERELTMVADLERVAGAASVGDSAALATAFASFHKSVRERAESLEVLGKIDLEVGLYRFKPFYYGLVIYLISFLLVAFSWLRQPGRIMSALIPTTQVLATAILVTGITMRCIIRGRPPVSTLYETILFVTAVATIVGLFIEWLNRRKVAQAIVPIFGALGLFIAGKYENHEAVDTMPSLVAVLDTNFWLATHVTTVTMGYSASLLASGIAHIYVLGRLFGWRSGDAAFYRSTARMVYGVLCFGLFFSLVGTVLGGIWANYSWGRFWGWDPKENGALMIVLAQLAILHSRMGGLIKNSGLCLAAIGCGMVVAFSWWGVNLLGVGLHAYGFISGLAGVLNTFYAIEAVVIIAGLMYFWRVKT